jgi:hypothetical protein
MLKKWYWRLLSVPLVICALLIMAVFAPFLWVLNPKIINIKDGQNNKA